MSPHGFASVLHCDVHFFSAKNLHENYGRGHATVIHGRTGPIKQNSLNRAAIGSLIDVAHDLSPTLLIASVGGSNLRPAGNVLGERARRPQEPRSRSGLPVASHRVPTLEDFYMQDAVARVAGMATLRHSYWPPRQPVTDCRFSSRMTRALLYCSSLLGRHDIAVA